ncbi:hypothetical protein [Metabacillus idriensis]|uniref:hypothetical protein n=1 Tax=Metabacillus idriensis TaxID=324768 RepID=UPI00174C015A|nr:hypothetical protein [Metabacillus idriensis]
MTLSSGHGWPSQSASANIKHESSAKPNSHAGSTCDSYDGGFHTGTGFTSKSSISWQQNRCEDLSSKKGRSIENGLAFYVR